MSAKIRVYYVVDGQTVLRDDSALPFYPVVGDVINFGRLTTRPSNVDLVASVEERVWFRDLTPSKEHVVYFYCEAIQQSPPLNPQRRKTKRATR